MVKKKAVGYIRISSDSQMENTSIEEQENRIRMYCELQGYELVRVYKDEGKSGGKIESRTEYNEMIEKIESGEEEIAAVVVNKIDRIHRSGKNLLIMIEDILTPLGVAFVSITEQFDTSTPMGKLFLTILGSFAEFERATINARTKSGRIATAKKHAHAGGAIAFGYKLIDSNSFTLEIVPEEAEIVEEIFRLREVGKSLQKIADHLNDKGKLKRGKKWSKQTIDYLLKNETYLGRYSYDGKIENNKIIYRVPQIVKDEFWMKK